MSKTTNKYAPEVRERAVQKISTLVARLAERGRLLVRDQTGSQVNTSCERSSG